MSAVQISPDALRQAGTRLGQVCAQFNEELNRLESELLSFGQPWGNDDIGQLIGVAYQEVVTWAFDCLKDVLNDLCQSGSDLVAQAGQWEEREHDITSSFDSLLSQIGSA